MNAAINENYRLKAHIFKKTRIFAVKLRCIPSTKDMKQYINTKITDMNIVKLWMIALLILCRAVAYAQFSLGNPKEAFSLSATVDGVANSDYTWDTDEREDVADGRMKRQMNVRLRSSVKLLSGLMGNISLAPFYNYSTLRLQTNWQGEAPMLHFPDEHHHYGATLSGSMNLLLGSREHGKPLTLMGTVTPNFSENGFEHVSGILGAMVHVTRSSKTYLGLGAVYIYGSSGWWPLWPLVVYRHQFDNRWSVGGMAVNWMLNYQHSPKVKFSLGTELYVNKIYFRPDNDQLPRKALYDLVSERIGLFASWQATKALSMELSTGINYPFYGRVRDISHPHIYMKLHADSKPYAQMKISYSWQSD